MRKYRIFALITMGILLVAISVWWVSHTNQQSALFNGQRAYKDVVAQVAFGPRVPNSQAHANTIAYIQEELRKAGWQSEVQNTTWDGFAIQNVIASRNNQSPQIILGAHYDSRILADRDPVQVAMRRRQVLTMEHQV